MILENQTFQKYGNSYILKFKPAYFQDGILNLKSKYRIEILEEKIVGGLE